MDENNINFTHLVKKAIERKMANIQKEKLSITELGLQLISVGKALSQKGKSIDKKKDIKIQEKVNEEKIRKKKEEHVELDYRKLGTEIDYMSNRVKLHNIIKEKIPKFVPDKNNFLKNRAKKRLDDINSLLARLRAIAEVKAPIPNVCKLFYPPYKAEEDPLYDLPIEYNWREYQD